jgi:hypothetical protein
VLSPLGAAASKWLGMATLQGPVLDSRNLTNGELRTENEFGHCPKNPEGC